MLGPFFQPLLLARTIALLSASALSGWACVVALLVLRDFRMGETSEAQLALARRAEIVAAAFSAALGISTVSIFALIFAADSLTPSIRGAMCAYGVFTSNEFGFPALLTSAAAVFASVCWLVLHRYDLSLPTPVLTRAKYSAALIVTPFVLTDLVMHLAFVTHLDFTVTSSCCSSTLDTVLESAPLATSALARNTALLGALVGACVSIALSFITWKAPSRKRAIALAVSSLISAGFALPAVVWGTAPYAHENPHDLCPFCLFHADVYAIGWPIFLGLLAAIGSALGLLVVLRHEKVAAAEASTQALQASLARASFAAWMIALVASGAPIVRYWVVSHGASLFGS